jgi:hypothetical protein
LGRKPEYIAACVELYAHDLGRSSDVEIDIIYGILRISEGKSGVSVA